MRPEVTARTNSCRRSREVNLTTAGSTFRYFWLTSAQFNLQTNADNLEKKNGVTRE